MNDRFQPGDHLKVRRPMHYDHHGIYISSNRVIQFGGGIWDKPHAAINAVPLSEFEGNGVAEVVRHGYNSWFTGYHPPVDVPWKTVERAQFLLKIQPQSRYNLIGHNCEHIANMCASGTWTESYQVRQGFGLSAYATAALLFWFVGRSRAGLPRLKWMPPVMISITIIIFGVGRVSNSHTAKFWSEIGTRWRDHELALSTDPRNEVTE